MADYLWLWDVVYITYSVPSPQRTKVTMTTPIWTYHPCINVGVWCCACAETESPVRFPATVVITLVCSDITLVYNIPPSTHGLLWVQRLLWLPVRTLIDMRMWAPDIHEGTRAVCSYTERWYYMTQECSCPINQGVIIIIQSESTTTTRALHIIWHRNAHVQYTRG